jgi:hypothetical protein
LWLKFRQTVTVCLKNQISYEVVKVKFEWVAALLYISVWSPGILIEIFLPCRQMLQQASTVSVNALSNSLFTIYCILRFMVSATGNALNKP